MQHDNAVAILTAEIERLTRSDYLFVSGMIYMSWRLDAITDEEKRILTDTLNGKYEAILLEALEGAEKP